MLPLDDGHKEQDGAFFNMYKFDVERNTYKIQYNLHPHFQI